MQKDRLLTRVVYKRIGFRREWHTKRYVSGESYMHKDRLVVLRTILVMRVIFSKPTPRIVRV